MENLTLEKLKDPKVYQQIVEEVEMLENFNYAAGNITDKLAIYNSLDKIFQENPNLQSKNPKLFEKIHPLYIKLKVYMIDFLTEDEIIRFFEEHFLDILKTEINYEERLRSRMMDMPYKYRDKFLDKIKTALENNKQEIGEYIQLGTQKANVKPYIKNWIKDYNDVLGKDRHFKIEIADYLFKSDNATREGKEVRETLKKLFNFYEKLKLKIDDPFSLSTYALSLFGIEAIGEEGSIKAKFKPIGEEEIPPEELPAPSELDKEFRPAALAAEPKKSVKEPKPSIAEKRKDLGIPPKAKPELSKPKPSMVPKEKTPLSKAPKPEYRKTDVVDLKRREREEKTAMPKREESAGKTSAMSMNSVDNIKNLNLQNFRAVSNDPYAASENIKGKISKLILESPENREKAKENWRQSDLYKLYTDIGRESMNTGMPIAKIISAREKINKPTLSENEFKAVVELSKMF